MFVMKIPAVRWHSRKKFKATNSVNSGGAGGICWGIFIYRTAIVNYWLTFNNTRNLFPFRKCLHFNFYGKSLHYEKYFPWNNFKKTWNDFTETFAFIFLFFFAAAAGSCLSRLVCSFNREKEKWRCEEWGQQREWSEKRKTLHAFKKIFYESFPDIY